MGKPTGFMEYAREAAPYRDPVARLGNWAIANITKVEAARAVYDGGQD